MADKSFSERMKSAARDPLWWVRLLAAVFAVIDIVFAVVVDAAPETCKIAAQCFIALLGLCFVLEGVRGRHPGDDKPMSGGERAASIGAGAILVVAMIVTGVLSGFQ